MSFFFGMNQGAAPPAGGGFSPTDIAGLQIWLDASAISGLSDGDPVSTWADQSGHNEDAVQATTSQMPTYESIGGVPAATFDGADDNLHLTGLAGWSGSTWTLVIRLRQTALLGNGPMIIGTNTGASFYVQCYSSTGLLVPGSTWPDAASSWADGAWRTLSLVSTGGGISLWVNGVSKGTKSTAPLSAGDKYFEIGKWVGGSSWMLQGSISDILVYDSALSDTDRESVEAWAS